MFKKLNMLASEEQALAKASAKQIWEVYIEEGASRQVINSLLRSLARTHARAHARLTSNVIPRLISQPQFEISSTEPYLACYPFQPIFSKLPRTTFALCWKIPLLVTRKIKRDMVRTKIKEVKRGI